MKVNGQLENAQLEQIADVLADPASTGRIYMNVVDPSAAIPTYYNGSAWKQIQATDTPPKAGFFTAVKTANYTAAIGDYVQCNTAGGAFNVTLPTAVGSANKSVKIIKTNSENTAVTILPNGAETMNGASSITLRRQYFEMSFVSDGANWKMGQIAPVTCSARAAIAATQTFSTGVAATVQWDTNQYESDAGSLNTSSTYSFTVPAGKGGQYLWASCLRFAATTTTVDLTASVCVNGVTQKVVDPKINSGSSQALSLTLVCTLTLVAGDVVTLQASQNVGGNLAIGGITENYMSITRVAD